MKTVLYARVSTTDQTLAHQEEQARKQGFKIDQVIADHGVSGVTTRLVDRPEGKRLHDILRRGDTLLVRSGKRCSTTCSLPTLVGDFIFKTLFKNAARSVRSLSRAIINA